MSVLKKLVLACLLATLLSGCMLPETIDAKIELDGYHYRLAVKSRVIATEALKALTLGQELSPSMEASLRAEEARALKEPGYTRFTYLGQGRYDAVVELSGELTKPGASIGFPYTQPDRKNGNFLIVERRMDGTVEVRSTKVTEHTKQDFAKANVTPSGSVQVTVAGKVLDSNATEKPSSPGAPYRWKISSWDDAVFLKIAAPEDRL
jgi:hypothetical protein